MNAGKQGTHCEIEWGMSRKHEWWIHRLIVAEVDPVVQGPSLR